MTLQELSARIGKTQRWLDVTSRRVGMVCSSTDRFLSLGGGNYWDFQNDWSVGWRGDGEEPCCDTAIAAGPDLAASWPLLLFDMPDAEIAAVDINRNETKFFCRPSKFVKAKIANTRAEAVALAWLQLFEVAE